MAYDFIYGEIETFIVHPTDEWRKLHFGAKKARERWHSCMKIVYTYMGPALDSLYLRDYRDEKLETSIETFSRKTIEFAIKKIRIKGGLKEKVLTDVINKLKAIRFIVGYPKEFLDAQKILEIYADVLFGDDQINAKLLFDMYKSYVRILREPTTSPTRTLVEMTIHKKHIFKYSLQDDSLCNFIAFSAT